MDLGFHLAMSYRDLKHPTSRKNFAAVVGQNHALILTQCLKRVNRFFENNLFWDTLMTVIMSNILSSCLDLR